MKVRIKTHKEYGYIALLKVDVSARNYTRKKIYYRAVSKDEYDTINITLGKVRKVEDAKTSMKPNKTDLKNVLIVANSGILVLNYSTESDALVGQEDDLVASLVSAIKSFANCLRSEEIERIEMTSSNITVLPSMANSLIFFMITDHSELRKRSRVALEEIRDHIIEKYRPNLMGDAVSDIPTEILSDIRNIIETIVKRHGYS